MIAVYLVIIAVAAWPFIDFMFFPDPWGWDEFAEQQASSRSRSEGDS